MSTSPIVAVRARGLMLDLHSPDFYVES